MAGLDDFYALKRHAVTVFCHYQSAGDLIQENLFNSPRHHRARLAGADDEKASAERVFPPANPEVALVDPEILSDTSRWVGTLQRRGPNLPRGLPQLCDRHFSGGLSSFVIFCRS